MRFWFRLSLQRRIAAYSNVGATRMPPLVTNIVELAESVRAFMHAPEYWRDAVGSNPKYFVHLDEGAESLFGLSKFCAFLNISLEDYITEHRNKIGGGETQRRIARVCGAEWMPLDSVDSRLRKRFLKWFETLTGGSLGTDNLHLITIKSGLNPKTKIQIKRVVSPEELLKRLAAQETIGQIGEEVALAYETNRLVALGASPDSLELQRTSLINIAAGFDIRSSFKREIRYIEVKASASPDAQIYISPNEIRTLQKLGDSAYLYLVRVTDTKKRKGTVTREIRNPFELGLDTAWLEPAMFTGKVPGQQDSV